MTLCKINDNSSYEKEELSDIGKLIGKIADKTLEDLKDAFIFPESLKDAKDITKDQMILRTVKGEFHTGNVMGFLGYEDERLIIESRFCGKGEDFFFQYLLERVLDIPNIVDLKTNADQNSQLFNFLLLVFPYYLKTALRKGLFKKYVRNRYNDGNIRGIIDIARHINQNTPFIGNVAYSQREFSYDNYLMELVRHTIEYIKGKPFGNTILFSVKDEVRRVIEVTPSYERYDRQKIIDANKKNVVRHAYFHEYLDLQRLCLMILQNQKNHIGSDSQKVYGILFDGSWLWEEYVNILIKDTFHHPRNKEKQDKQHLFTKQSNNDRNNNWHKLGEIYPDFISRDSENRIIADAKYKSIDNIGNKDYLQVLAYMFRFEAKEGYYLYPEAKGNNDEQLWLNRGSTYEKNVSPRDDIHITKHGLKIPMGVENYETFKIQMASSEKDFQEVFVLKETE